MHGGGWGGPPPPLAVLEKMLVPSVSKNVLTSKGVAEETSSINNGTGDKADMEQQIGGSASLGKDDKDYKLTAKKKFTLLTISFKCVLK